MLAPEIIASIVTAAGEFVTRLFGDYSANRSDQDVSKRADKIIAESYEDLRRVLTDNSVRVLRCVMNGQNWRVSKLRVAVHQNFQPEHSSVTLFDDEFQYRLKYLASLGLLFEVAGGREYAITPLGMAFAQTAQKQKDYFQVFSS